jgi:hypothetical protein
MKIQKHYTISHEMGKMEGVAFTDSVDLCGIYFDCLALTISMNFM